jgi:hypothetical protein
MHVDGHDDVVANVAVRRAMRNLTDRKDQSDLVHEVEMT